MTIIVNFPIKTNDTLFKIVLNEFTYLCSKYGLNKIDIMVKLIKQEIFIDESFFTSDVVLRRTKLINALNPYMPVMDKVMQLELDNWINDRSSESDNKIEFKGEVRIKEFNAKDYPSSLLFNLVLQKETVYTNENSTVLVIASILSCDKLIVVYKTKSFHDGRLNLIVNDNGSFTFDIGY